MDFTSLAFKVYLILSFELTVLYGCAFWVIQKCKKAFYSQTTFLGIAFAEAVNANKQTDIAIVQTKKTTLFFFYLIIFAVVSLWTGAIIMPWSNPLIEVSFMTFSAIGYGSLIGFITMDMDENDGMTGLKLATLTTAAMFVLEASSGINFANPVFVGVLMLLVLLLLLAEIISLFFSFSRGAVKIKAIAGIAIFSMMLLSSISLVEVTTQQGLNDWDTAIYLAFSMYLDIINIILYFLDLMG